MVVHPAAGNPDHTLVNALLAHCKDLSGIGGELRPGIVHRLDKDTTGVIVAAKNDRAHLSLSKQFSDRTVSKEYLAVTIGRPSMDKGTWDDPIGRHPADRKRMSTRSKPMMRPQGIGKCSTPQMSLNWGGGIGYTRRLRRRGLCRCKILV